MKNIITFVILTTIISLVAYSIIGYSGKVEDIKRKAPADIESRGWKILRYEGFKYGSWANHGGKVWYHVADTLNPGIQYRVYITMWNDELQYYYGAPEVLQRIEVKYGE